MLSMAPDLVLNLIYGNAACSTYEQKERDQRPGRCQKVRHTWVKLGEQQQQQQQKEEEMGEEAGAAPEAGRMVSNR